MTRLVGLEVARLVEVLRLDPAKVHIIGHSLGAHIAGYAGERIPGQRREHLVESITSTLTREEWEGNSQMGGC